MDFLFFFPLNKCVTHTRLPKAFGWTYLYLFGGKVLGASEHIALSNPLAAQLMNLNHAAKCDEAHKSVGGQQTEGHLERLLESLEIFFFQTCVHHIQEDERSCRTTL